MRSMLGFKSAIILYAPGRDVSDHRSVEILASTVTAVVASKDLRSKIVMDAKMLTGTAVETREPMRPFSVP